MPKEDIIRAKWAFDGAKTLEEAAQMLEKYAAGLRKAAEDGWELTGEIYDDYGIMVKKK